MAAVLCCAPLVFCSVAALLFGHCVPAGCARSLCAPPLTTSACNSLRACSSRRECAPAAPSRLLVAVVPCQSALMLLCFCGDVLCTEPSVKFRRGEAHGQERYSISGSRSAGSLPGLPQEPVAVFKTWVVLPVCPSCLATATTISPAPAECEPNLGNMPEYLPTALCAAGDTALENMVNSCQLGVVLCALHVVLQACGDEKSAQTGTAQIQTMRARRMTRRKMKTWTWTWYCLVCFQLVGTVFFAFAVEFPARRATGPGVQTAPLGCAIKRRSRAPKVPWLLLLFAGIQ